MVDSVQETKFLYELAFGFMPRRFDVTEEDRVIYDEEEEVVEMYFCLDGIVGVGYSLICNGILSRKYSIAKKHHSP